MFLTIAQEILKLAQTQILVENSDKLEMQTLQLRALHSFSVGHRYIQYSN
jgi:hypothetical protein